MNTNNSEKKVLNLRPLEKKVLNLIPLEKKVLNLRPSLKSPYIIYVLMFLSKFEFCSCQLHATKKQCV